MCGNGLISVSTYLHEVYGISEARFVTEIPTSRPKVRSTRVCQPYNGTVGVEVVMGPTRLVPLEFYTPRWDRQVVNHSLGIELIPSFQVLKELHSDLASSYTVSDDECAALDAAWSIYITYSGEPHVVLVEQTDRQLARSAAAPMHVAYFFPPEHPRETMRPLRNIGHWLNRLTQIFPQGINICIARRLSEPSMMEMRSFERGILHETFACGTGSVAAAAVASVTQMITSSNATIIPYWVHDRPKNVEEVRLCPEGWHLTSVAEHVFSGTYILR